MPSRASSASRSSHPDLVPFFPKVDGPEHLHALKTRLLPIRPQRVEPVLDPGRSCKPIVEFDEQSHSRNYPSRPHGVDADLPPQQPDDFADPYLMPSLTRNERLRLTMLWYYSRDVLADHGFLGRLQDKLELVQKLIGWEFAIVGLLKEDAYTRLVTAGLPLAILPRRESTCSHTINQDAGVSAPSSPRLFCHLEKTLADLENQKTVFMLPDMDSDWRFRNSPHVAQGGLRSYAGTQLRCRAQNGEEISLGSLCVASNSNQPPLSAAKQDILVRFADVITSELVNQSREARKRQRLYVARLLGECRADNPKDGEEKILEIIRTVYPDASVEIRESRDGAIGLPDQSSVHLGDIHSDGLWEDVGLIESLIRTMNHTKLETEQTIRAIVRPFHTYLGTRYIVLASSMIQHVLDDVDTGFIEDCAKLLSQFTQEYRLKEALKAKESFSRGITHQLRTPIHGILGSCDLLAEELTVLKVADNAAEREISPMSFSALNTIRDSGRELMSTINNILKMNRWADSEGTPGLARLRALNQIEVDIMHDVHQVIPERDLANISIFFQNQLPEGTIEMEITLLKECIQALIINALQYTDEGAVITVISAPPDFSRLTFDVLDTGCGIAADDQQRIFEPYEKVDPHTRGVGLGLTLAAKIAAAMDGSVTLVNSSQEPEHHGSCFRAEFLRPNFASLSIPFTSLQAGQLPNIPRSFHVLPISGTRKGLVLHFAKYLEHRGFEDSSDPEGAMILLTYTHDSTAFLKLSEAVQLGQVAICMVPAGAVISTHRGERDVLFFSGPFLTSRLEEMLKEVDTVCKSLQSNKTPSEAPGDAHLNSGSGNTPETTHGEAVASIMPVALLVDDNVVNLKIFRMYCEKRRIPYRTAVNGREAVEQFELSLGTDAPVNMVLMDLQMPICDGIEATRQIRDLEQEKKPRAPACCIFMVTGQDSGEDKTRSFEAGADEFYVKPMSIQTLDRGLGERFPAFKKTIPSREKKLKS